MTTVKTPVELTAAEMQKAGGGVLIGLLLPAIQKVAVQRVR